MKRWLRRILLLALLGAAVAAVAQRRQPQRPPLTVVPPPPREPVPPVPASSPAVVAEPDPEPVAEPEPLDEVDDEDSGSEGFGGFAAFSSSGAPVPGDHPGSVRALASGAAPGPEYTIKGNADSMIFHTPDSPSYERTVAEVWFTSEDDALAAGFRAPKRRGKS